MENPGVLNFEVGQLVEKKSFEYGYRGSWFRCRIKDIQLGQNKILLEYYDFDAEEESWEKIYEVPPYGWKTNPVNRQLMVRPQYPVLYKKSEMPPINLISEACVVIDGTWKVGDMVDWVKDDCYWSARVIKVLSDDKVQIKLPMPPSGEGGEGEEVFCKDLRPFLDWSETQGWTLPTVEGQTSGDAPLINSPKQESVITAA